MLRVPVTTEDHVQGEPSAPVTLVEYGDYECPHCGRAHPIVKRIQKHFGKRLAFVVRNFPLRDMHPMAEPAAETAEFAGTNGRFWEMHDAIFENQESLGVPLLLELSAALKLPQPELESALEAHTYEPRVRVQLVGVHRRPTRRHGSAAPRRGPSPPRPRR